MSFSMCSVFPQAYDQQYAEPSYEGYEGYYSQPAPQPWVLFVVLSPFIIRDIFDLISMTPSYISKLRQLNFNLAHDFSEAMSFSSHSRLALNWFRTLYKPAFVFLSRDTEYYD